MASGHHGYLDTGRVWRIAVCAARAHSPAILAFGADSLVELFSAAIVLLQFLPSLAISERRAGEIAAILLFALAALITVIAALSLAFHVQPEPNTLSIGVTVVAHHHVAAGLAEKAGSAAAEQYCFGSRRHPVGNLCLSCWPHTAWPRIKRNLSHRMV